MTASDGAFGPVTYTMPYARLRRLSRTGARRSYGDLTRAWSGLFLAGTVAVVVFEDRFNASIGGVSRQLGLAPQIASPLFVLLAVVVFIAGLILIRRRFRAKLKARVGSERAVTLRPATDGLHFAASQIEYIVKWQGIHELLREPDGIVVVVGAQFFLVPDQAFATADARHAFLDHLAANLTPEARARSETELQRARRT